VLSDAGGAKIAVVLWLDQVKTRFIFVTFRRVVQFARDGGETEQPQSDGTCSNEHTPFTAGRGPVWFLILAGSEKSDRYRLVLWYFTHLSEKMLPMSPNET
jgi:hypothetical protein